MSSDGIVTIEHIGAAGDGVATGPSRPVFLAGALPGERFRLVDGAAPERVGAASADRRSGYLCSHAPRCGGCTLQHMSDDLYRTWKSGLLAGAFKLAGLATDKVRPMITVPLGSRRRAVLTAARIGGAIAIGFHEAGSHRLIDLRDCAVLVPGIVTALPALRDMLAIVLDGTTAARVTALAAVEGLDVLIGGGRQRFSPEERSAMAGLAGRARIVRLTLGDQLALLTSTPHLDLGGPRVAPPPGAFVQAVEAAEAAMRALVVKGVGRARHSADLFAGVGTFALPLAQLGRVVAIDSDRKALAAIDEAARHASGLKPIETRGRDLMRDPLSPRELDSFDAIVFDPPRAGAKAQAEALARSKVPRVVAVSCNPATLARDIRILTDGGYEIESATPVDQFVFTPHLEAVVVLARPSRPRRRP